MARSRTSSTRELPPPLPPEQRTVGQLVAESIRLYGANFWPALALGVPVAFVNALGWAGSSLEARLGAVAASVVVMPAAFVVACAIATGASLRSRAAIVAYLTGVLVFVPFPFLVTLFILPGLAWLALFALAVPAALVERLDVRAAFGRGLRLARADYVHVLGGLAALGLVVLLTQSALFFVLREYAESTQQAAATLASLVVSPLLFLGAALLYVDQDARLRSRAARQAEREERDADLPDAEHADREGRADPPRQPGAPA
jgi:hypothetical protein